MGMDHYCLACAFAVIPRASAPLRASGLTAQRCQARRGLSCQNAKLWSLQVNPTCDVLAENPVGGLGTFSHKLLDSAKLI